MTKMNIYLLRGFFDGFSYSFNMLDYIANNLEESAKTFNDKAKGLVSDDFLRNQSKYQKAMQEYMESRPNESMIFIMMLGIAELISVSEETEKVYHDKILRSKLDKLKFNFDYKFVRDALAHWEDYVTDKGREQIKGEIPTTKDDKVYPFPHMVDGKKLIHYNKELDILLFRNEVKEILMRTDEIIGKEYGGPK